MHHARMKYPISYMHFQFLHVWHSILADITAVDRFRRGWSLISGEVNVATELWLMINIRMKVINKKRSDEYWYSNVSKRKHLANLFIFPLKLSASPLSGTQFGRRGNFTRVFDLKALFMYRSPLITSLILVFDHFSCTLSYASSFFHPISFYTITHAFTRAPSCRDLEKTCEKPIVLSC